MRRPPDKDNPSVTDRDVDTSNATLNTLLGGRQKSWMLTPRGAPVRPTPRAAPPKPALPKSTSPRLGMAQVASADRLTDRSSLPSPTLPRPGVPQAASADRLTDRNSLPSPTLPRPGMHQAASADRLTDRGLLPSPTSSLEPSPVLSHTSISNLARTHHPSNNENQRPTTFQHNAAFSHATPQEQARAQAILSSRPALQTQSSNRSETQASKSPAIATSSITTPASVASASPAPIPQTLQSPTISPALGHRILTLSSSPSSRPSSRHATDSLPVPQQNAEPQASRPESQGQVQSPIPINSASSSPRTRPVMMQNQQDTHPRSRSTASPHPNKRQRTHSPVMMPLKPRVALINAHIASIGGNQKLNNTLERPRFSLLEQACNVEDSFYVALHQLFCAWDSNREEILNIDGLPPPSTMILAFKILGHLIRENEGLSPHHLRWFSQFPSPLGDLMRTSAPYRRTLEKVGNFLEKLTSEWATLSTECSARRYPPLVDELVQRMGLLSPTLQQIVFTATRRNLGIQDDSTHIGREMEKLFLQDRQQHQELADRIDTARPPTQREITERNTALSSRYQSLDAQYRQQHNRMSGPARDSSGMIRIAQGAALPRGGGRSSGPPVYSNSNPISYRSSIDMSQPAWNHNAPSPNLPVNWNHTNAQAQTSPLTSAAPVNNLTISTAGRPPSWAGQRDVPSPTFMQNLSMQSPSLPSPIQQDRRPTPILRSNSMQQSGQNPVDYGSANWNGMANQNHGQVGQHQNQYLLGNSSQPQHLANGAPYQQGVAQTQQVSSNNYPYQRQNQLGVQAQLAHQQNQQQLAQQVLSMNRAAHLINNGVPILQQQRHNSRNNSVPRNSRPSPAIAPAQVPVPSALMQVNPAQLNVYNQSVLKESVDRQLIPPTGYTYAAGPLNSDNALHQAHVRSPRLVPADFEPATKPEDDPKRRFYQAVRGFVLHPIKVPATSAISKSDFTVPNESYALIPRDKWPTTDRLPTREYRHGTLQFRLRCIQTKQEVTKCLLEDWVVTDTSWPDSIFMELNGKHLDVRRKAHHGKDLPIDITSLIVPPNTAYGSVNRIKISVPRLRDVQQKTWHFIAIEVIEILANEDIMNRVIQHRVPAERTLASIRKALGASNTAADDDDFAMVVSDLSVDLADPFTAKIFDIPVRGSSCMHRECFDLNTWLMTRNSKNKRPYQPCMVDQWKCPLCGADARPYSLEMIEFFANVRTKLEQQGNLDCKAILIAADGSWRPKPEAAPAHKRKAGGGKVEDEDSDDEALAKKAAAARAKAKAKPAEIIELD